MDWEIIVKFLPEIIISGGMTALVIELASRYEELLTGLFGLVASGLSRMPGLA
ncbi:MAG: hypothetical protein WC474_01330 [Hydrogenophilaceae bacterium]